MIVESYSFVGPIGGISRPCTLLALKSNNSNFAQRADGFYHSSRGHGVRLFPDEDRRACLIWDEPQKLEIIFYTFYIFIKYSTFGSRNDLGHPECQLTDDLGRGLLNQGDMY